MTHQTFEQAIKTIGNDFEAGEYESLTHYIADLLDDNYEQHHENDPAMYYDRWELHDAITEYIDSLIKPFNDCGLYHAAENIKQWVEDNYTTFFPAVCDAMTVRKYWLSDDKQATFGSWPLNYLDSEVWSQIKEQIDTPAGTIRIGEYSE